MVRPLSTVDNTRYARVSHSRQWSNYSIYVSLHATAMYNKEAEIILLVSIFGIA